MSLQAESIDTISAGLIVSRSHRTISIHFDKESNKQEGREGGEGGGGERREGERREGREIEEIEERVLEGRVGGKGGNERKEKGKKKGLAHSSQITHLLTL